MEGVAGQEEARQGGVLLLPGVGLPPFLVQVGEGEGRERGEVATDGPRAPPPLGPNRTRRGGRRPPFLLSLLFPPSRIIFQLGKGGVQLPEGVGLLLARLLLAGRPPLLSLYIQR